MGIQKIIKWWLTGILLFFPFLTAITRYLSGYNYNTNYIRFIDEITIVILLFPAIWQLYRKKELMRRSYLTILISILVFSIAGLISGVVNNNSLFITALGTFDYVKYFLVIFIYAAFIREIKDYKNIYRLLFVLGVFLSFGAIFEEIWALTFKYLFGKDILDPVLYIFRPPLTDIGETYAGWRFGIYRAGFIIKNPVILGYYLLFIFTIYIALNKKKNPLIISTIFTGILVTVSRMPYAGLIFALLTYLLYRMSLNKKIFIAFISCAMIFTVIVSTIQQNVIFGTELPEGRVTYRTHVRNVGMSIWEDYPLIGVGPGMFGGIISIKYESPYYSLYKFQIGALYAIGSIDQFWPQVFAETGGIGFILFTTMLISIVKTLLLIHRDSTHEAIKELAIGLLVFMLVIYTFTMGTGFNTTEVVFHFFAFVGMAMGTMSNVNARQVN